MQRAALSDRLLSRVTDECEMNMFMMRKDKVNDNNS